MLFLLLTFYIRFTNLILKRSRIVSKTGELRTKIDSKEDDSLFSCKYIKDIFISTLNLSWFWTYMMFSAAFLGSWLIFAVVWYIIFWIHDDFNRDEEEKCVSNVKDFTTCFLFSGIFLKTPINLTI